MQSEICAPAADEHSGGNNERDQQKKESRLANDDDPETRLGAQLSRSSSLSKQ